MGHRTNQLPLRATTVPPPRRLAALGRCLPSLALATLVAAAGARAPAAAQPPNAWLLESYSLVYTEDVHEEVETRRIELPGATEPVFEWGGRRDYTDYPHGSLITTGTLAVELPDVIRPGVPFVVGGRASGVVSTPGREGLHRAAMTVLAECYLPSVCPGTQKSHFEDDIVGRDVALDALLEPMSATLPTDPANVPSGYMVRLRAGIGTTTPGDPYWRVYVYATYRPQDIGPTPTPAHRLALDADATRLPPSGASPSEATITASMLDGAGQPVAGERLRFALDPPDMGTLSAAEGVTDAAGEARVRYRAPDVPALRGREAVDVLVTNPARGLERRLPLRIERYGLSLRVEPDEVPVEPVWRAIKVTAQVLDFDGRPVAGDVVALRVDPPDLGTFIGERLVGGRATTDAAGRVEAFFEPVPPSQLAGRDRATIYAANVARGGEVSAGLRFLGLHVIRTWPLDGKRDVELTPDDTIDLEFDRPLDAASVNSRTVSLSTRWHGDLVAEASALASTIRVRPRAAVPDVGLAVTVRVQGGEDGVRSRDGAAMIGPHELRFTTMPRLQPEITVSQVVDGPRDPLYGMLSLAIKPFALRVAAGIPADSELDYEDVDVRIIVPRRGIDELLRHRYYPGRWPPSVPDAASRRGNTANLVVPAPFGRGGYAFRAELQPAHAIDEKVFEAPEVVANANAWIDPAAARRMGVLVVPLVNDRIRAFDWTVSRGQQQQWLLGLGEPAGRFLPLNRLELRLGYLMDTTCQDPDVCHYATAPWTELAYWAKAIGRSGFATRLFGWRYAIGMVPPGWLTKLADHEHVSNHPESYHGAPWNGIWALTGEAGRSASGGGFPIVLLEAGTPPEALVHALGDILGIPDAPDGGAPIYGYDPDRDLVVHVDGEHQVGARQSIMSLDVAAGSSWPSVAEYEAFLAAWTERSCFGPPPCPPAVAELEHDPSATSNSTLSARERTTALQPADPPDPPDPVPVVLVSGTLLRPSAGAPSGRLDPLLRAHDVPTLQADGPGDHAIELRSAQGAVLARYPFAPDFGPIPGGELAAFLATVPDDPAAATVAVTHGGRDVASRARSASPPSVAFTAPADGALLSGAVEVAWRGDDADGEALTYTLLISSDAGATWAPLLADSRATSHRLDAGQLPGGPDGRLRVIASDGFEAAEATRAFVAGTAPSVLAVYPPDGARDVPQGATVQVYLSESVDPASVGADGLALLHATGRRVAGQVGVEADATIVLTPTLPLAPFERYQVRLSGAMRTLTGRTLGADRIWGFTTRGTILYLPLANRGAGAPYRAPTATIAPTTGPLPTAPPLPSATQRPTSTRPSATPPGPQGSPTPSATVATPPGPTPTADAAATQIAATLTALAPTPPGPTPSAPSGSPSPTPDAVATAVAATLTALAPPPSATPPAASVVVLQALTTGADPDHARMAFARGEAISLWAGARNDGSAAATVDVAFDVLDDLGAAVPGLSWQGPIEVPAGEQWLELERTVPASAALGPHVLRTRLTHGGRTTEATTDLFLAATLLRADDFSNPSSGWQGGQDANGRWGYVDGEFEITFTSADAWRWAGPPHFPLVEDVALEAEARIASGTEGAVGLVFGMDQIGGDFHLLDAFSDGRYAFFRRRAGAWESLTSPQPSERLRTGSALNHLLVARHQGLTYVYANGGLVSMITDLAVPAGRVAIYSSTVAPGFEARFDEVRAFGME